MEYKDLLKLNNGLYGCSEYLIISRCPNKTNLIHEIKVVYEDGTILKYSNTDSLKKVGEKS